MLPPITHISSRRGADCRILTVAIVGFEMRPICRLSLAWRRYKASGVVGVMRWLKMLVDTLHYTRYIYSVYSAVRCELSVSMSLLAMLDERSMYGLELKNVFEESTGGVWPLNVGQVYTTIARLERDGLVALLEEADGQKLYEITAAGRERVAGWFGRPSQKTAASRDEIVLKLSLAILKPGVDMGMVIQSERRALVEQLQEYTRLKSNAPLEDDLAWLILLDSFIFKIEARVRWLDACEARIARSGRRGLQESVATEALESEVRR